LRALNRGDKVLILTDSVIYQGRNFRLNPALVALFLCPEKLESNQRFFLLSQKNPNIYEVEEKIA